MMHDAVWQIGQRLMTGFPDTEVTDELRQIVAKYRIGNFILFEHNVENKEQLRRLCAQLQELAMEVTGAPALIAIDQEGGIVPRSAGGRRTELRQALPRPRRHGGGLPSGTAAGG